MVAHNTFSMCILCLNTDIVVLSDSPEACDSDEQLYEYVGCLFIEIYQ